MPSLPRAVEIRPVAFEHEDLIELLDKLDDHSVDQDAIECDLRSHERVTCRSFAILTMRGGHEVGARAVLIGRKEIAIRPIRTAHAPTSCPTRISAYRRLPELRY